MGKKSPFLFQWYSSLFFLSLLISLNSFKFKWFDLGVPVSLPLWTFLLFSLLNLALLVYNYISKISSEKKYQLRFILNATVVGVSVLFGFITALYILNASFGSKISTWVLVLTFLSLTLLSYFDNRVFKFIKFLTTNFKHFTLLIKRLDGLNEVKNKMISKIFLVITMQLCLFLTMGIFKPKLLGLRKKDFTEKMVLDIDFKNESAESVSIPTKLQSINGSKTNINELNFKGLLIKRPINALEISRNSYPQPEHSLEIKDSVSIFFWVKPLEERSVNFIGSSSFKFWNRNNHTYFTLFHEGQKFGQPGAPIPVDEWSHIVGTYEKGGSVKIYRNGKLVDEKGPYDYPLKPFNSILTIGSAGGWGEKSFDGHIDDIKIWTQQINENNAKILYEGYSNNNYFYATNNTITLLVALLLFSTSVLVSSLKNGFKI